MHSLIGENFLGMLLLSITQTYTQRYSHFFQHVMIVLNLTGRFVHLKPTYKYTIFNEGQTKLCFFIKFNQNLRRNCNVFRILSFFTLSHVIIIILLLQL